MQACLKCDWVLNPRQGESKLSDLLGTALQWLDYKGVKGVARIEDTVTRMLGCMCESRDAMLESRRSLLRLVSLFVPGSLKREFVQEFLNIY